MMFVAWPVRLTLDHLLHRAVLGAGPVLGAEHEGEVSRSPTRQQNAGRRSMAPRWDPGLEACRRLPIVAADLARVR